MTFPWDRLLSRLIYILVFTFGYALLTKDIPCRFHKAISFSVLATSLFLLYLNDSAGLGATLVRYLMFMLVYTVWSLAFLLIQPRYAVYLSVFFTVLMGVWFSSVQIILSLLSISSQIMLILLTGLCRILSVFLIGRFFIRVDPERSITLHEMLISLFPAATCFLANLLLFELITRWGSGLPDGWQIPVSLLVLFFGLSALIVLVHSETYFQINKLRRESELARQQLEEQYKLFLKEQEANEQVRALRHDIQNHLHTIEKMAASDDASDIRQYVSDLQAAAGHAESASVTGNATLDALLTAKMPVFEKNGIRFENYLSLRDVTLFSPMEICTLFANATDNAVEALADSRITDKYIHMSGGIIHENLVVKIKNPYQHELRYGPDHFESTKKIDRPHGYGLMNIERIIEEHRGSVSYKTDDSVFAMVWMVPLESRSSAPNARG